MKQIFNALEHIHAHSIAHRDVKLENVLISERMEITLIDFGLCGIVDGDRELREWCGSDNYLVQTFLYLPNDSRLQKFAEEFLMMDTKLIYSLQGTLESMY